MTKKITYLCLLLMFFSINLICNAQSVNDLEQKVNKLQNEIKTSQNLLKKTSKNKETTIREVELLHRHRFRRALGDAEIRGGRHDRKARVPQKCGRDLRRRVGQRPARGALLPRGDAAGALGACAEYPVSLARGDGDVPLHGGDDSRVLRRRTVYFAAAPRLRRHGTPVLWAEHSALPLLSQVAVLTAAPLKGETATGSLRRLLKTHDRLLAFCPSAEAHELEKRLKDAILLHKGRGPLRNFNRTAADLSWIFRN